MLSGGHNCWMRTCECGEVNGGCAKPMICDKCGKQLTKRLGPNDYEPDIQDMLNKQKNRLYFPIFAVGLNQEFKEDYQI